MSLGDTAPSENNVPTRQLVLIRKGNIPGVINESEFSLPNYLSFPGCKRSDVSCSRRLHEEMNLLFTWVGGVAPDIDALNWRNRQKIGVWTALVSGSNFLWRVKLVSLYFLSRKKKSLVKSESLRGKHLSTTKFTVTWEDVGRIHHLREEEQLKCTRKL